MLRQLDAPLAFVAKTLTDRQSDGRLLEQFIQSQDQSAFAALVHRHRRMVEGVCRRILGNRHDVEDAFQATFLVLVKKASCVRPREMLGNWLYGVACRVALKARTRTALRMAKERQVMPAMSRQESAAAHGLAEYLDLELSCLPDYYRVPIVLCDLEGRSRKEVSRQLGWKEGTLSGRLSRGRALLARRLRRHGLVLSAGGLAAALATPAAADSSSALLARRTIQIASSWLHAANGLDSRFASPRVCRLVDETLKGMMLAKLGAALSLALLVVAFLASIGFLFAADRAAPEPAQEPPRNAVATTSSRLGSRLLRQGGSVQQLAFAPDGSRLVTAGDDGTLRVWSIETGKELHRLELPRAVPNTAAELLRSAARLVVSADSKRVACLAGGRLMVWDIEKGTKLRDWDDPLSLDLAFSPRGESIITLVGAGKTVAWNIATGKNNALKIEPFPGTGMLSPDLQHAVLSEGGNLPDAKVTITDLTGKTMPKRLPVGVIGMRPGSCFSPDGQYFGWLDNNGIHVFDVKAAQKLKAWQGKGKKVASLSFSANSRWLVALDDEQVIHVYEVASAKEVHQLGNRAERGGAATLCMIAVSGIGRQELPIAVSPDGKTIATSFGTGCVRLFDVATEKERSFGSGHLAAVRSMCSEGGMLHSLDDSGVLLKWDRESGKVLRRRQYGHLTTLSETGRWCAAIRAGKLQIIDGHNDKVAHEMSVGPAQFQALALAPDGKTLAARGAAIQIWDISQKRMLHSVGAGKEQANRLQPIVKELPGVLCSGLRFSPDGRFLAGAGAAQQFCVWDVKTGAELWNARLDEPVHEFIFSPNGAMLALVHGENRASIYETVSGARRLQVGKPAARHAGIAVLLDGMLFPVFVQKPAVPAAAFSWDGCQLALSGRPGAIHVWNLLTAETSEPMASHDGPVRCLCFSPDHRYLFSGGNDTTIAVHQVARVVPRRPAARVGQLSAEEIKKQWSKLGSRDGEDSWAALVTLSRHPRQSTQWIRGQVKPVGAPAAAEIARWIEALADRRFATRQQAHDRLAELGEIALPAIEKALAADVPLDVQQRLSVLKRQARHCDDQLLRSLRALELLELIGDAAAREELVRLAAGARTARLTSAAQRCVDRLHHRLPEENTR